MRLPSLAACLLSASVLASGCWRGAAGSHGEGLWSRGASSVQRINPAEKPALVGGPAFVRSLRAWGLRPGPVAACRQHATALAPSPACTHVRMERGSPRFMRHMISLGMCGSGEEAAPTGGVPDIPVRYDFEAAGPAREGADNDARLRIWQDNQMAWSPLQSPVMTAQAVTLFQRKAAAKATALRQRALALDGDSEIAITQLGAVIDDETAMRREIAAYVQILLQSSPFRGVGSLAVETDPSCRQKLHAWLRRTGARGAGAATGADGGGQEQEAALLRLLDECARWQEGKQAEEQAVLLPLIAFSCLKNAVARRSMLDVKARAEIEAVQTWLAARSAMHLTLRAFDPDAHARSGQGSWRRPLSADPSGSLMFCKSSAALVRWGSRD